MGNFWKESYLRRDEFEFSRKVKSDPIEFNSNNQPNRTRVSPKSFEALNDREISFQSEIQIDESESVQNGNSVCSRRLIPQNTHAMTMRKSSKSHELKQRNHFIKRKYDLMLKFKESFEIKNKNFISSLLNQREMINHNYKNKIPNPIEKLYECDKCDYKSTTSSNLNIHKRIHTKEKPYECVQCEYKCSTSGNLKSHKRVHKKEKPYKCEQCDYKCKASATLVMHKRIHLKEKPYECDKCEKKFSDSSHLKSHRRIHPKEKPFKCDQCEYICTTSNMLKVHQRKHFQSFQCDQCDKKFTQLSNLNYHKRVHSTNGLININRIESSQLCPTISS